MPDTRVLVVDDERSMRELLAIMLRQAGHEVTIAEGGEQAVEVIKSESFDLVITDLRMRKVDGIAVLRAAKEHSPSTVVLVVTAFASTETAVEAMRPGAATYRLGWDSAETKGVHDVIHRNAPVARDMDFDIGPRASTFRTLQNITDALLDLIVSQELDDVPYDSPLTEVIKGSRLHDPEWVLGRSAARRRRLSSVMDVEVVDVATES